MLSSLHHLLRPTSPRHRLELENDIADELRFHLEMRAQDNVAMGMSPEEAMADARRRFGNIQHIQHQCLDTWEQHPLRVAASFGRTILTLTIGIGAVCTVFLLINAILIQNLPFRDLDRITGLWVEHTEEGWRDASSSLADFVDWREQQEVFDYISTSHYQQFNLTDAKAPERIQAREIAADYFKLYGTEAFLGRLFRPDELEKQAKPVAILNYHFWQRRYNEDPQVIGQTIYLDGAPYTVVGVMPSRFQMYYKTDLLIPLRFDETTMRRGNRIYLSVGRLKQGISREEAQAHFDVLSGRLAQSYPETNTYLRAQIRSIRDIYAGPYERRILYVLLGIVCLVLIVACASVLRQHLARSIARQQVNLNQSVSSHRRTRVVLEGLGESILLAGVAGLLGVLLASSTAQFLLEPIMGVRTHLFDVSLNGSVLGFGLSLALLIGVMTGLAPLFLNMRRSHADERGLPFLQKRHRRVGAFLMVAQVALALALLISAGEAVRSLMVAERNRPGFNPDSLAVMPIILSTSQYPTSTDQSVFFSEVFRRIEPLPEVKMASLAQSFPTRDNYWQAAIQVEERDALYPDIWFNVVGRDYLDVMQIPLQQGRRFERNDYHKEYGVALINETMAARLWPGVNPVGQRFFFSNGTTPFEIIGVVGDVRQFGQHAPVPCGVYLLSWQFPRSGMNLIVHANTDLAETMAAVQREVRAIDATIPLAQARSARQILWSHLSGRRTFAVFLGLLALLALWLAAWSIHRTISERVKERTREIGLRLAMGASRRDVLAFVLRPGLWAIFVGTILGLGMAFWVTSLLAEFLFGINPTEPLTYITFSLLLAAVTCIASTIPAWQASRLDPLLALRHG